MQACMQVCVHVAMSLCICMSASIYVNPRPETLNHVRTYIPAVWYYHHGKAPLGLRCAAERQGFRVQGFKGLGVQGLRGLGFKSLWGQGV